MAPSGAPRIELSVPIPTASAEMMVMTI